MTIGIFAFDGTIDPAKYSDCKVYIANPIMPAGLAYQLNAGILNLMNAGCDSIVFMGNHCTPQDDTVKSHIEQLESHLYPLVTCGRVLHPDNNWKDYREAGEAKRLGLFNRAGTIIQNSSILTSGYGISIANFGMNRAAIDRISRFSKMYFDSEGPVPVLLESRPFGYGKVLSLCAWCARVTIFMLPTGRNNAVVYNADGHNPFSANSGEADDSDDALKRMGAEMAKQPLGLDFFDSPKD
jgi:hypothetical protein